MRVPIVIFSILMLIGGIIALLTTTAGLALATTVGVAVSRPVRDMWHSLFSGDQPGGPRRETGESAELDGGPARTAAGLPGGVGEAEAPVGTKPQGKNEDRVTDKDLDADKGAAEGHVLGLERTAAEAAIQSDLEGEYLNALAEGSAEDMVQASEAAERLGKHALSSHMRAELVAGVSAQSDATVGLYFKALRGSHSADVVDAYRGWLHNPTATSRTRSLALAALVSADKSGGHSCDAVEWLGDPTVGQSTKEMALRELRSNADEPSRHAILAAATASSLDSVVRRRAIESLPVRLSPGERSALISLVDRESEPQNVRYRALVALQGDGAFAPDSAAFARLRQSSDGRGE